VILSFEKIKKVIIMGIARKMKDLTKEYMRDPKGQYYRHLKKILDLHKQSGVSKIEVLHYCQKWYDGSK